MTVGDQACNQVDQEIDGAVIARVLDLTNGFEWIVDGLEDGSLAQEKFVRECEEQTGAHALAQLGDERNARGDQELLSQWLRKLALVAKSFPKSCLASLGTRHRSSTLPGVKQKANTSL